VELVAFVLTPFTFAVMLVLEQVRPGRPLPRVRGWHAKGLVCFGIVAVAYVVAMPRLAELAADLAPVHAPPIAAVAAFVVSDVISYAIHRRLHRIGPLWRIHQLHHSAERVDVAGAAYLHPFDLALQLAVLLVVIVALGLTRAGAALAGYLALAAQLFTHVNVHTPQWLGWIIQRPEAHSVHHARGIHAYNYGALTLCDMVFGTFRNPAKFSSEPAGFWDGSSSRVLELLVGRDVTALEPVRGDKR
jgi:sterol desaturase/sphingolipid hydroxylase (fatty acid hydroxylase superfamily)